MFEIRDGGSGSSSFSGGSTIDSTAQVELYVSSTASGGTIQRGPLGTATVNINGGTLQFKLGATALHNAVNITGNNTFIHADNAADATVTMSGALRTNGYRAILFPADPILFDNVGLSSADSGTISFFGGLSADRLNLSVSSGTSSYGGGTLAGAIGEITDTSSDGLEHLGGFINKTGDGVFQATHFRVEELKITDGTVRVHSSGTNEIGADIGTSRLNSIGFDNDSAPGAILDLENNDLVVTWKSDDPIGSLSSATSGGGIARMIQTAFNNDDALGTPRWQGHGITSSQADDQDYAIGYADSQRVLMGTFNNGTALWSGQIIYEHDPLNEPPFPSVLIKYTYYGDASLDGDVDIGDFALQSPFFNTSPSRWDKGDFNYDGTTNIGDFSLLASHYNWGTSGDSHPQLRGTVDGPHRLEELFIAILDHPAIYWESWLDPFLRDLFNPLWSLNLGTVPGIPPYLQAQVQARGIPEPSAVVVALVFGGVLSRRLRRTRSAR